VPVSAAFSLCLPIDIDHVFYGAFDDRELIRSPTDTCIKLTSGVRLPTHQPNGECHASPSPPHPRVLHRPLPPPAAARNAIFGVALVRRNAKGDNKAIASNIKRPWIIVHVSREEKKKRGGEGRIENKKEEEKRKETLPQGGSPLRPLRSVFAILRGRSGRARIADRSFEFPHVRTFLSASLPVRPLTALTARYFALRASRVADERASER